MCEKWLTFDNKLVLEILVEACRPRTREQCAKEFIMFLSVAIPQKFKVNADNFSKDFYEPMMKSLHDLDHLSALFMKDSSIRTQNKATVPVKTPNQRSKVRCWQSNPLSKVHESKIGYYVKLQYEGRRKRRRRKNPLRKLDCLPKIWLYYKIQIQGRNVLSAKYIP